MVAFGEAAVVAVGSCGAGTGAATAPFETGRCFGFWAEGACAALGIPVASPAFADPAVSLDGCVAGAAGSDAPDAPARDAARSATAARATPETTTTGTALQTIPRARSPIAWPPAFGT